MGGHGCSNPGGAFATDELAERSRHCEGQGGGAHHAPASKPNAITRSSTLQEERGWYSGFGKHVGVT